MCIKYTHYFEITLNGVKSIQILNHEYVYLKLCNAVNQLCFHLKTKREIIYSKYLAQFLYLISSKCWLLIFLDIYMYMCVCMYVWCQPDHRLTIHECVNYCLMDVNHVFVQSKFSSSSFVMGASLPLWISLAGTVEIFWALLISDCDFFLSNLKFLSPEFECCVG